MLTHHRARRPVVVALALATLVLTGCTSEPEHKPQTAIPSPATPAPSPTPADEPTSATPEDPLEASLAVVMEYAAAYGPGFRAGDGSALIALGTESCKSCIGAAKNFSEWRDFGGTRAGGDVTITDTEAQGSPSSATVTWRVHYRQSAMTVTQPDGTSKIAAEASAEYLHFEVVKSADQWLVNGIRREVVETHER